MDVSNTVVFKAKVTFDEVFIARQIAAWHKANSHKSWLWNNFHASLSVDDTVASPSLMCVVRIDEASAQQNVYDCEIGVLTFDAESEALIVEFDRTLRGYIRSPAGYLGRPVRSVVGVCELTRVPA